VAGCRCVEGGARRCECAYHRLCAGEVVSGDGSLERGLVCGAINLIRCFRSLAPALPPHSLRSHYEDHYREAVQVAEKDLISIAPRESRGAKTSGHRESDETARATRRIPLVSAVSIQSHSKDAGTAAAAQ
jgi:hypothetical protein